MLSTDVLIIGGGIAGTAAALAAAARGARVVLVQAAPGATALAAGGWAGAPPPEVRTRLAAAGLLLDEVHAPLPHPDGRLLSFDLAPPGHAAASLTPSGDDDDGRTLVCGIDGLPSFRAAALAALWADDAGLPPASVMGITLTVAQTPPAGWAAPALAALLEREPERLGEPLSHAVRRHGAATRLILPAVLGVDGHARVREAVTAAIAATAPGACIGEALGTAPSLPGWRLHRALLRTLAAAGVEVLHGRAVPLAGSGAGNGAGSGASTVTGATIRTASGHESTVRCAATVLATGKFIGGGVTAEPHFREPALGTGIALSAFGRTFGDATESLALTAVARAEPQPLLGVGVEADADGMVSANVCAAGAVRAGTTTATLGLGTAAREGWAAGNRAADMAARA